MRYDASENVFLIFQNLCYCFYRLHHDVFDVTPTDNFQYQAQLIDTDSITQCYRKKHVQITDKIQNSHIYQLTFPVLHNIYIFSLQKCVLGVLAIIPLTYYIGMAIIRYFIICQCLAHLSKYHFIYCQQVSSIIVQSCQLYTF